MHYEVELGLVMGKELKDLDPEDHEGAMSAIDSQLMRSDEWHAALANSRNVRLHPQHRYDSPECSG